MLGIALQEMAISVYIVPSYEISAIIWHLMVKWIVWICTMMNTILLCVYWFLDSFLASASIEKGSKEKFCPPSNLSYLCILTLLSRAVKRKGFGQQVEGSSSGRHDAGITCGPNCPTTSAGSGGGPSSSSGPGTAGTAEPQRTGSEIRREPSDRQCSASVSQVSNMSTHSGIHHSTSSGNGSIKDLPLTQVRASFVSSVMQGHH